MAADVSRIWELTDSRNRVGHLRLHEFACATILQSSTRRSKSRTDTETVKFTHKYTFLLQIRNRFFFNISQINSIGAARGRGAIPPP